MDGLGGGTNGFMRNRYYQRLDADVDVDDGDGSHLLSSGSSRPPPSARHRKRLPSSRRAKLVKAPAQASSSTSQTARAGAAPTSSSLVGSTRRPTTPTSRRGRSWRIRLTPRLAFLRRVASFPARLLRRLQHGYVRMMLRFAGAMGGADPAGYTLPRPSAKEYDDQVLVEIYRALVAQGHVLVVPAAEPRA